MLELNKQYTKLKSEFLTNSVIFWSRAESSCNLECERMEVQVSEQKIGLFSIEIQESEVEINGALELKEKLDLDRSRLEQIKREDTDGIRLLEIAMETKERSATDSQLSHSSVVYANAMVILNRLAWHTTAIVIRRPKKPGKAFTCVSSIKMMECRKEETR